MTTRLIRVEPGHYTFGDIEVRDAYDPSGPPHTRWVTLLRCRWLVTWPDGTQMHFDRLRDARVYLERQEQERHRSR